MWQSEIEWNAVQTLDIVAFGEPARGDVDPYRSDACMSCRPAKPWLSALMVGLDDGDRSAMFLVERSSEVCQAGASGVVDGDHHVVTQQQARSPCSRGFVSRRWHAEGDKWGSPHARSRAQCCAELAPPRVFLTRSAVESRHPTTDTPADALSSEHLPACGVERLELVVVELDAGVAVGRARGALLSVAGTKTGRHTTVTKAMLRLHHARTGH